MSDLIFVFSSNLAGRHSYGAAARARKSHGAVYGQGSGRQGNAYAIPVQDHNLHNLPIRLIREFVDEFIAYATMNSELSFRITDIGGGLLGFKPEQIAPLFKNAPMNCQFTTIFKKILKR